MDAMSIYFKKIINSKGVIKNSFLNIKNGNIESISLNPKYEKVLNYQEYKVFPGFIDIHTHGYFGVSYDSNENEIHKWAKLLAKNGVTSFIPTCVSLPNESMKKFIDKIRIAMKNQQMDEAEIIGARSEGPYISIEKKGAHNINYIRKIDLNEINDLIKYSNNTLKIIDIAPELEYFNDALSLFQNSNIIVSAGHTNADFDTGYNALLSGVNLITHFYNAMTQFDHRNPGMVGAGLLSKNVFLEIIADFHHVSKEAIEIMFKTLGYDNIVGITDSLSLGGTDIVEASLGGLEINIHDNVAWIKNTNTIAGSVLTMLNAYKNFKKMNVCDENIAKILSYNPSKLLNLDAVGDIAPNKKANLCIFDDNDEIIDVIISGKSVFN